MPKGLFIICTILLSTLIAVPAFANSDNLTVDEIFSKTPPPLEIKDGSLRLTSNKNAFIKLDRDAHSVIVNNPDHASVMLDTPRLLIVVPHKPGTTSFTVLDRGGDTIIQKDIIITNVQKKYVRIRRMCNDQDPTCVPSAYYYCPDGCYEVSPVNPASNNSAPPPVRSNGSMTSGALNQAQQRMGSEE